MKTVNKPTPPCLVVLGLSLLALPTPSSAASFYKLNTATMNNPAGDWTPSGAWLNTDTLSWAPSGTSQAVLTLPNSMNLVLGGNVACTNLDLRAGTAVPAATAIVINPDGNTLGLYSAANANNLAAIDQRNGVLSTVINCPITLFTNVTIRNSSSGDLTIGSAIGESGGSRAVTLPGLDGWVNFSGANTYSGLTTVSAQSLLTLSGSGKVGNGTGGLTMGASISGGWLDLGGTTQSVGAINFGSGALIQNGTLNGTAFSSYGVVGANLGGSGALTLTNSGSVLVLSGNLSYTGGTTNTAGTILTTKPLPLSGNIVLGGTLAARVGGAGEWTSTDFVNLLSYGGLSVSSGGTLGFDSTDGNFSYANPISGPTPANLGLLKQGANTLTLSGPSTYEKATTIKAGTLTLQGATGPLSASSPLTFTGSGTFNFDNIGASGSTSQSLGALTFTAGEGKVLTTRTANSDQALTFGSLAARPAGATGNFVNSGSVNGAGNGFNLAGVAQGFINQGLFFNGADYAYLDGAGTFVRAPGYGSDTGFTAANTITPGTHSALTSTPSAQNSLTLNTLKLSGSGVGFPLNSGQVLSLANGGILKAGGGTAGAISGGNVQTMDSSHDLVVRTDSASDSLTVSSVLGAYAPTRTGTANATAVITGLSTTSDLYQGMTVTIPGNPNFWTIATINSTTQITLSLTTTNNGSVTLLFAGNALTKSGAGTLTLTGANTNLVGMNLNGGRLNINSSTALGIGVSTAFTGAAQNTPIGTFVINDGTTIDNASGATLQMAYKYRISLNGSVTFVGTSDLYFIDPNQNGNIRMTNDVTLTTQTKDKTLRFASNIGVSQGGLTTAKLTKNGPGTLQIGSNGGLGANGGLVINEGVYASFAAATSGQSDQAFSGPLFLGDTTPGNSRVAIIDIWYGNPHSAPITVRAGSSGTLAMYGANNNAAAPTLYGPTVLNNTLTLATASGTFSHYGLINGTGGVTIGNTNTFVVFGTTYSLTNAGTVALFNRNTYTGNTVVNSGTLKLGALGTINNSPLLSLAAGTTLDVSATTNYVLSGNTALRASGAGTTAGAWARIIGPSASGVSLGSQPIILRFAPASLSGDSTHPALYVSQGALTLNNNPITVTNTSGSPLGAGTYTLVKSPRATSTRMFLPFMRLMYTAPVLRQTRRRPWRTTGEGVW